MNSNTQIEKPPTFRQRVQRLALASLKGAVPASQIAEAAARFGLAFGAAHRIARDPSALEKCSEESLGACIALSSMTGLMPGGPHALVYLVPQAARKGETPELQWRPTHRAYAAVAFEEMSILLSPVAVHEEDTIKIDLGQVLSHESCGKLPARTRDPKIPTGLLGVYVLMLKDGRKMACPWVPAHVIDRAESSSKAGESGPWHTDYAAMAMGAAIRYLHGRGAIPSSSARFSAVVSADESADIEVEAVKGQRAQPRQAAIAPPAEDLSDDRGNQRDPVIAGTASSPSTMNRQAGDDGDGA